MVTLAADVGEGGLGSFQWQYAGKAIAQATNAVYALPFVDRMDEGEYTVVAGSGGQDVISEPLRLIISNVQPTNLVALGLIAPVGEPVELRSTSRLDAPDAWQVLANVVVPSTPMVWVDPSPPTEGARFYQARHGQLAAPRWVPGWRSIEPLGSILAVEFMDPSANSAVWQTMSTYTVTNQPAVVADISYTGSDPRVYRSILLESPANRRQGRALSRIRWNLPREVFDPVVSELAASLQQLGITVLQAEASLVFPTKPLGGAWIAVGDQRVMCDTNGFFQIDVEAGATNGFILDGPADRLRMADGLFDPRQLSRLDEPPADVLIDFVHDGLIDMDHASHSAPSPANRRSSAKPADKRCGEDWHTHANWIPWCLDYDGDNGDGCKYDFGSPRDKFRVYWGSTCQKLVTAGRCNREWNAHTIIHNELIGCFSNHKYRNCQMVDGTFSVTAESTTINWGESTKLRVHNNSWGNVTEIRCKLGQISGKHLSQDWSWGGVNGYTLEHFDDSGADCFIKGEGCHLEDLEVTFTAPAKPVDVGAGEVRTAQIDTESGGLKISVPIKIVAPGPVEPPVIVDSVSFGDAGGGGSTETICLAPNAALLDIPPGSSFAWSLSTGALGTDDTICLIDPADGDYSGTLTINPPLPGDPVQTIRFRYGVRTVKTIPGTVVDPCGTVWPVTAPGFFTLQGVKYGRLPFAGVVICSDP